GSARRVDLHADPPAHCAEPARHRRRLRHADDPPGDPRRVFLELPRARRAGADDVVGRAREGRRRGDGERAVDAAVPGGLPRDDAVLLQLSRRRLARCARSEGPLTEPARIGRAPMLVRNRADPDPTPGGAMALLEVRDLDVTFATPDGDVHAVKRLSFDLERGEMLGIVGESGSGKSQSMLALLGLLADNGRATGSAKLRGRDLIGLPERELRDVRGRTISMIFQDPMTSLNPYRTIGDQMIDVLRAHERVSRAAARARCIELLDAVRIPDAAARLGRYPHEMSGGMRQRVMIASSLLLGPEVLVADEPTTALDVTVQAQILELLKDLKSRFGTAIVMITHDLGVVAGLADRVLVM